MVAGGGKENLGLIFETPKGLTIDNTIPIALKGGADGAGLLLDTPPRGLDAGAAVGGEILKFPLFYGFPYTEHNFDLLKFRAGALTFVPPNNHNF
jgi:hypothetical protein